MSLVTLRRALGWVIREGKPSHAAVIRVFLALALSGFFSAYSIPWLRKAVDAAVKGESGSHDAVIAAAIIWWLCNAASALLGFGGKYGTSRLAASMASRFRERVHAHLIAQNRDGYAGHPTGDLLQRGVLDAGAVQGLLLEPLALIGSSVSTFLFAGYFLARMNLAIALLAVPIAAGAVLVNWRIWSSTRDAWRRYREAGGRMWSLLLENVRGMQEIRAFGRQHDRSELYRDASREFAARESQVALVSAGITASFSLLLPMAGALMLGIAGLTVLRGKMTAGELAAFCSYGWMLTGPLSAVARQYETFHNGLSAAGRVFELLGTNAPPVASGMVPRSRNAQGASVEVTGLTVAGRDGKIILDNIDLTILPGEMVAIVGHSGAGKTTLVETLLGLGECSAGEIRINGVDLPRWPEEALREHTAMLFQNPVLFRGTVADNVLFGAPIGGGADLTECLIRADAEDFISSLPHGPDTLIAEEGHGLSMGERCRIALARALARSPRLLILDEPTASVDGESERRIQSALIDLRGTLTCIIISHHPSMARIADRVIFLESGRIMAEGVHSALLANCPEYAEMFGAEAVSDHAVITQGLGGTTS